MNMKTDCSLTNQAYRLLDQVTTASQTNADDLCATSDAGNILASKKDNELQQKNASLLSPSKPSMSMSASFESFPNLKTSPRCVNDFLNASSKQGSSTRQSIDRSEVNDNLDIYSLSLKEDQDSTTSFDSSIAPVERSRVDGRNSLLGVSCTQKKVQPSASRGKSSRRREIQNYRNSDAIQKVPSLIICKTSSNKSISNELQDEWHTSRCDPALSRATVGFEGVSFDSSPRKPTRKESWNDRPRVKQSKSHVSVDSSPVKPTRQRSARCKDVESMVKSLSCENLLTELNLKNKNDLSSGEV